MKSKFKINIILAIFFACHKLDGAQDSEESVVFPSNASLTKNVSNTTYISIKKKPSSNFVATKSSLVPLSTDLSKNLQRTSSTFKAETIVINNSQSTFSLEQSFDTNTIYVESTNSYLFEGSSYQSFHITAGLNSPSASAVTTELNSIAVPFSHITSYVINSTFSFSVSNVTQSSNVTQFSNVAQFSNVRSLMLTTYMSINQTRSDVTSSSTIDYKPEITTLFGLTTVLPPYNTISDLYETTTMIISPMITTVTTATDVGPLYIVSRSYINDSNHKTTENSFVVSSSQPWIHSSIDLSTFSTTEIDLKPSSIENMLSFTMETSPSNNQTTFLSSQSTSIYSEVDEETPILTTNALIFTPRLHHASSLLFNVSEHSSNAVVMITRHKREGWSTGKKAGVSIAILLGVAVICFITYLLVKRRPRRNRYRLYNDEDIQIPGFTDLGGTVRLAQNFEMIDAAESSNENPLYDAVDPSPHGGQTNNGMTQYFV